MVFFSSNVDEAIRAFSNLFYKKISHAQKAQNAHKRTKTKRQRFYALKKHLRGKKSLIRLCIFCALILFVLLLGCVFVFFVVFFVRVKSFRKNRFEIALMTSVTLLLTDPRKQINAQSL